MKMSRREQLIQEELRKLMWVPPGRTQEQHRTWLQAQVKWLPQGQDTQVPPSPKPPMNIQALRMLAFIRVVEKLISSAKDIERDECATTVAATPRKQGQAITALTSKLTLRDRWMRLTKMTIIPVAVAALAGFVGGYNSRAPNHPVEVAVARSPEIRRAIPVEPEIRKAVPVQTRKPQVNRRSDSMAFISPGSAIARDFATRRANANPLVGKTSRSVVRRKASK